ncbi:MAG: phage tail protein [Planctomycetes bacterium]|nr:phage tail protein [Planctomycetota bacterium]
MVISISVKSDVRRAMRSLDAKPAVIQKATMRALNKVSAQVKTQATRTLAKRMGVPAKRVRADLHIQKASPHRLSASVTGTGRSIKLIHFRARQTRPGAAASPWGKRKKFPGTFIADMPSGHRGVFKRKSKASHPIKELYGPGVPKEMAEKAVTKALDEVVKEKFVSLLRHEVGRLTR